jgi:NTE family protein
MRNIMLVLGGGGIKGLAHIGVVKALEQLGIPVSEYVGTSAGAIVAAMAASGMKADEIEKVGLSIRQSDIFDFNYAGILNPSRIKGLCKGDSLRQFIKRAIPVNRFSELPKPLFLSAVDIGRGETISWGMDSDQEITLHDAVYASCAIPGIFPPQKIGDAYYFDGGIVDNLPLQFAKTRKPDMIIAVRLGPRKLAKGDEVLKGGILSIMEQISDIKDRELAGYRGEDQADIPLILIEPDIGNHQFFKFHNTEELIFKGVDKTLMVLKAHAMMNNEERKQVSVDEAIPHAAPSLSLTIQ